MGRMQGWYKLASYLRMSIQRVQQETTASEFVVWMEYLKSEEERKFKEPNKQDLYMAQIAAEVRRGVVQHPEKVQLKDFLFDFDNAKAKKDMPAVTKEEETQISKACWFGALGMEVPRIPRE